MKETQQPSLSPTPATLALEAGNLTPRIKQPMPVQRAPQKRGSTTCNKQASASITYTPGVVHALLGVAPQYVFWKNTDSEYIGCNERFARLVGLDKPSDIVGKTDHDLPWQVQGDNPESFRADDKAALKGQSIRGKKEWLALPGREARVVSVTKVPFRDSDGHLSGILGIAEDITQDEKYLHDLKQSQVQDKLAAKAERELLANLSRNFRRTFSGIISIIEADVNGLVEGVVRRERLQCALEAARVLLNRHEQVLALIKNGSQEETVKHLLVIHGGGFSSGSAAIDS
jgi:transcriptional regulator with PAS, ATPase and Fis domain